MNWRNRTLIIGAIAGLIFGLASAYIVIQRSEQLDTLPEMSPGDGVKIGLGLLGVLRLISDVSEKG